MTDPAVYMAPDWVILGVQNPPDGVFIIASTELGETELRLIMKGRAFFFGDPSYRHDPMDRHYELEATMQSYVLAYGTDYADAMRKLFERWKPEAKRQPALPSQPGR